MMAPVDIFVVGISEFHVINDSYGYEAGNLVLHNFAQQVLELLDEETKFFRLNGVKFAIVMHSATHEEIQKLYEQLKKLVNKQLYLGKNQARLYTMKMIRRPLRRCSLSWIIISVCPNMKITASLSMSMRNITSVLNAALPFCVM